MKFSGAPEFLLRLGVAFAFLFPPANALLYPYDWVGYVPRFFAGAVPEQVLLYLFGLVEVTLALWILSGRRIFWPALAAAALLVLIVLMNLADFQILFRDLSIAAAALALAAMHRPARVPERSRSS